MQNNKIEIDNSISPISGMAKRPVAANLLMLILILGGIATGFFIKQEVFPIFDVDIITIKVPYNGASPEEIENSVILVVEEAINGIDGIKSITSTASENIGVISVELINGYDGDKATRDIQNAVDRISTFPSDADNPIVSMETMRRSGVTLAVYGDVSEEVLRNCTEKVRTSLLQDKNINQIDMRGQRPLEMSINVSKENLRRYNLTLEEIGKRIKNYATELPGGSIKSNTGDILLRMDQRKDYGAEFKEIPIITNGANSVLLKDIATIKDGFEDVDKAISYNSKPAILLTINLTGNISPIEVSDSVKKQLAIIAKDLPKAVSIAMVYDDSKAFKQRIDLLLRNAYLGLALVFGMLAIFLQGRLAFWVTMGIPTSFLGALLLLPAFDVSINMVTLFAFIISLGIVVDDAIVIGENIFEWRKRGYSAVEAAIHGTREVAVPVTFSILTNIAAFLPLAFVPGVMGKVFSLIPIVVILIFIVSFIEGILILPSHLSHGTFKENKNSWKVKFSNGLTKFIEQKYAPLLDLFIKYRYIVLAISLSIFIITIGFIKSGRLGMTLFPIVESEQAVVTVVFPYGVPVEQTNKARKILEKSAIQAIKFFDKKLSIHDVISELGRGVGHAAKTGTNIANVQIMLGETNQRSITVSEFIQKWRELTPEIPCLQSINFLADFGGPGQGASLTLELRHTDIHILEQAATEVALALKKFDAVRDIDAGFSPGKPQINFNLLPEGQSVGLTASSIARQIRNAYFGYEAFTQQRGRNELTVKVRLPLEERVSLYDLEHFILKTPNGGEIPLVEAVSFNQERAYTEIKRRNGFKNIIVTANVIPKPKADIIRLELIEKILPKIISKYPNINYSFEGHQKDMRESMSTLAVGFIIAVIVIYGLLAIPFNSYIQPIIIMISIPFGIVGAVLGHILMGFSLSILSMFGIIALAGVVVNDSLVLIDYANRKVIEGINPMQAIRMAGIRRFRPIILTSITTFGGLAPMIFETSQQARFLIPMAVSLGYGILFATVIALLIVPCLFMVQVDLFTKNKDLQA